MNIFDLYQGKKRVTILYADRELLKVDATVNEGHGLEAQATKHGIEDGSEISDHIIKQPRTLTMTGIISDDPIDLAEVAIGNLAGVAGGIFGGIAGAAITGYTAKVGSSLVANAEKKPTKSALEVFEDIWLLGIPVSITTGLRDYNNMIMERLSIPVEAGRSNELRFTASFSQITIVSSEVVPVTKENIADDAGPALDKTKQGNKSAEIAEQAVLDKVTNPKTWAFGIGQRAGLIQ